MRDLREPAGEECIRWVTDCHRRDTVVRCSGLRELVLVSYGATEARPVAQGWKSERRRPGRERLASSRRKETVDEHRLPGWLVDVENSILAPVRTLAVAAAGDGVVVR